LTNSESSFQSILDQCETFVKCEEADAVSEAASRSEKIARIKADIARVEAVILKTEASVEQVRYPHHLFTSGISFMVINPPCSALPSASIICSELRQP
jgi:hypothetical protein